MPESSPGAPTATSVDRSPTFGTLLRRLRIDAGLSQDGLAERAGISAKTIGALEQGARRAAHDDTIHRIARALDLLESDRAALLHSAQHSRARHFRTSGDVPPRSNMPTMLTSFVDRREVEEIVALLDSNRLVTITGTGGVGKTRTAIEAAHRTADPTLELWFVDLSNLRTGEAILPELVSVSGTRVSENDGAFGDLVRHLNAHPSRLLLDNCEHLLDDLADIVPRLLHSCPQLSILATSREALRLSFETSYRLPSLEVPSGRIASLEQGLDYSAVRLFLERTEARHATWLVKPQSLDKLAMLCRQLDGIPLAIELASSRVATLGLDMLLEELTSGVGFSGNRDLPARHRTMEATIAWSYDLLDTTEKAVLRRLSVFAGSFSLDVARRICADSELPAFTIVDACHRLAHKSLIVVEHGDPMRYRLLGAILSFAEARLSPSERDAVQFRYVRWLVEMSDATQMDRRVLSMTAKKLEFDNVRAGVRHCLKRAGDEDVRDAAAIIGGLWDVWFVTNRNRELKRDVEYLLNRLDAERDTHLVSLLLLAVCAYSTQQDLASATMTAIPVLLADGNVEAAGRAIGRLSNFQFRGGDVEAASRSLDQAFAILEGTDPAQSAAYWQNLLERAWQSCAQGNVVQANAYLEQLKPYLNDGTDPGGNLRRRVQTVAAEIAFVRGDTSGAIALLNASILDVEHQTPIYTFMIRTNLAMYNAVLGNTDVVLKLVRTTLEDLTEPDWSPLSDEYHYILIPAALAAIDTKKTDLAAIILGHWSHHGRNGRIVSQTEAPGYDKLLGLLDGELAAEEMGTRMSEGAAIAPDAFVEYLRSDSLFGPA